VNKVERRTLTDDNDLVEGLRRGDPSLLERLYKTFFPTVTRLVLNNGGDIDDAKDVFQETVLVLYDKVSIGDFNLSSKLKTYIYSVSRNIWLKKLNKKGIFSDIADYVEKISTDDDIERKRELDLQFQMMESALLRLGEPCQTIIRDFYMHNLSMQDLCDKFGYTNPENAKTQKYKCLQRLKRLFFAQ